MPSIATHPGLGGGALGPPNVLPGGEGIHYVVPGDYDEDGCLDFAADDSNGGRFHLWTGDCEGAFEEGPRIDSIGFDGEGGDFNGDGRLDLATVLGDVCVNLGRGDGRFDPPVCYGTGVNTPNKMVSVDLNGDGWQDFVVTSIQFDTKIGVLLSNGDGTFQPAQQYASPLMGGGMASGDFDSDGRMDIALASFHGQAGVDPELDS